MAIVGSIQGGFGSFDSELNDTMVNATTNAELTLFLRVHLQQVGGAGTYNDFDGVAFQTIPWTADAWASFCRRYQEQGRQYWHGKYWLATPESFHDLGWPRTAATHRPNVWCRFRLSVAASAAGAHTTIRVVRLAPRAGLDASTFRSDSGTYDNYDLGRAPYLCGGRTYRQRTIIHEIGHALGLPHIGVLTANPACTAGDTNALSCYGVTPTECRDVMGMGMALSEREARPWLERIAQHTDTNSGLWRVHMHRYYPQRLRVLVCG